MRIQKNVHRRDFLKIIAVAGGGVIALKTGLAALDHQPLVSETRLLMGTLVNLTIVGADQAAAQAAIAVCVERMEALESLLSRFKPESQLSKLNCEGWLTGFSADLLNLLSQSCELSEATNGAFDITVKPLLDLYESRRRAGVLPEQAEIDAVLPLVGYQKLDIGRDHVFFEKPGMSITLDGIAKGYIVDCGIAALKALGFTNVLVEAGGDLYAAGQQSDQDWQIGVLSPRVEQPDLLSKLKVRDQAVATSGDYMQAYTRDFSHHHIIDPRTGHSPPQLASVSILSPSCAMADGLATAIMVMGVESGLGLLESLPSVEGLLVSKDLKLYQTTGMHFEPV